MLSIVAIGAVLCSLVNADSVVPTGTLLWQTVHYTTWPRDYVKPDYDAVNDRVIFYGKYNCGAPSSLLSLTAATGAIVWNTTITDTPASCGFGEEMPRTHGMLFRVATNHNYPRVVATDVSSGSEAWWLSVSQVDSNGTYISDVAAIDSSTTIVLSVLGTLIGLDATVGHQIWKSNVGGDGCAFTYSYRLGSNDAVVACAEWNGLSAWNLTTGVKLWTALWSRQSRRPLVIRSATQGEPDVLVTCVGMDNTNVVYALDAATGGMLWQWEMPAGYSMISNQIAATVNGRIIAFTMENLTSSNGSALVTLQVRTGVVDYVLWNTTADPWLDVSVDDRREMVYAITQHHLFAIVSTSGKPSIHWEYHDKWCAERYQVGVYCAITVPTARNGTLFLTAGSSIDHALLFAVQEP